MPPSVDLEQEYKLSPSLFNYYIADMTRPTPPVKRVCYADDITVWASGPKTPQLESIINSYLRDVAIYLKENSLLISAPKSTVTLFTPDTQQFQTHPNIAPSLSFHKHCNYVTDRVDKRNNMLKALTTQEPRRGPMKETLHSRDHSTVHPRLGVTKKESPRTCTHTR